MADENTSFMTLEISLNDHVTKAAQIWEQLLLNRSREMETGKDVFWTRQSLHVEIIYS